MIAFLIFACALTLLLIVFVGYRYIWKAKKYRQRLILMFYLFSIVDLIFLTLDSLTINQDVLASKNTNWVIYLVVHNFTLQSLGCMIGVNLRFLRLKLKALNEIIKANKLLINSSFQEQHQLATSTGESVSKIPSFI